MRSTLWAVPATVPDPFFPNAPRQPNRMTYGIAKSTEGRSVYPPGTVHGTGTRPAGESRSRRHPCSHHLCLRLSHATWAISVRGHASADGRARGPSPRPCTSAGFKKTRIVLRQWNPNFRSARPGSTATCREMLLVSSMQIHSASAYEMIDGRLPPRRRPAVHPGRRRQGDLRAVGLLRPRAQPALPCRRGRHRRGIRHPGAARSAHGIPRPRRAPAQDVPPPAPLRPARRHSRPGLPRRGRKSPAGPAHQHRHAAAGAEPRRTAAPGCQPGPARAAAPAAANCRAKPLAVDKLRTVTPA